MCDRYYKRNVSEFKRNLLDDQITMLENMISACKEIRDGAPETRTCAKYNVNVSNFRNLLFNKKLGFVYDRALPPMDPEDEEFISNFYFEGGINFEEAVYKAIVCDHNILDIPPDIDETIPYVLNNTLDERERDIIYYKYRDMLTLGEIADIYGLKGPERIRQILAKALRKCRHPSRFNIIRYGLDYYKQLEEFRKNRYNTIRDVKYTELEKLKKDAQRENDLDALLKLKDSIDVYINDNYSEEIAIIDKNQSIDVLELSVRSYNCLIRARVNTIEDLKKLRVNDLFKIRNCGPKCIKEILEKCREYNIILKEE